MANTFLEQTRALHEDLERLERVIVKDYKQDVRTHKEKLMQNHRVRRRLEQMQSTARKLLKVYDDGSEEFNHKKEEIAALGGTDQLQQFSKFYDRLKDVRDYHKRFPVADITEAEDDTPLLKEEPAVEFTGEEGLGRYLDLHECHRQFQNAKGFGRRCDYLQYLDALGAFGALPKAARCTDGYRRYLHDLLGYLTSFYERTQPLSQLRSQLERLEREVAGAWDEGGVAGWEDKGRPDHSGAAEQLAGDLEAFESVEELETLGAEKLKEHLALLGLKCGGTPRQRAERLWALRGKQLADLDAKLFAKGTAPPQKAADPAEAAKREQDSLASATLEAKVARLLELLVNVVRDTRARVEKKATQTYEEVLAEMEEAEAEDAAVAEGDEEEEEYVYNPLKLPLGWDGKPIPYWLYKLHGLNQEFKCEICGNYSYWGRRAFERHFKEWRHSNGMRALGIPNNKDFFEVTQIEDALALWKSLQSRQTGGFNPETDEELEDAAGNVYNKKTYEDLRRQGLL